MYKVGTRVGIHGFAPSTHEIVEIEIWESGVRYLICPVDKLHMITPGQKTVPVSAITEERIYTQADEFVTDYGLLGPTTDGILWFGSAEGVAEAWHSGEYPNAALRLSRNGRITHGTIEEVQPVYDALALLRSAKDEEV